MTDPIAISMEAARSRHAAFGTRTGSSETTGTKDGVSSAGSANRPSFAALIQFDRCCGIRSCRRATSAITAPRATASATIRPFSSSVHRHRRTTPVTSARRRTRFVSSLMSTISDTRSQTTQRASCAARHTFNNVGSEHRLRSRTTSAASRIGGASQPATTNSPEITSPPQPSSARSSGSNCESRP